MLSVRKIETLAKLSSNIFEVVKTKNTFLGRDCQVLTYDQSIPLAEVADDIESVYDRIIVEDPKPRFIELAALKAALKLYGWMVLLQNYDRSFTSCDINPVFAELISKIDRACRLITPDSERSTSLQKLFQELHNEYANLRKEEFFKPEKLKQVRRIMSLLVFDEQSIKVMYNENLKLMPRFFSFRDFPVDQVDNVKTIRSLQCFPPVLPEEEIENGWPVSLIRAIRELGDEDFGLALMLSSLLKKRGLESVSIANDPNTTVVLIHNDEMLSNLDIYIEALNNPNLKPILRGFISYLFRVGYANIIQLGKTENIKINSDDLVRYIRMIDAHSNPFSWEKEAGFLYNNMGRIRDTIDNEKQLYLQELIRINSVLQEHQKASDSKALANKRIIDLCERIIVPMTDKKDLEGIDIGQINMILSRAEEKLTELTREYAAADSKEGESRVRAISAMKQKESSQIKLGILEEFQDLPKTQVYLEEALLSKQDYERLYGLLYSRLFDTRDLNRDQKLRALEAQRPFFADKTDPVFPPTLFNTSVDKEPKIEKVKVAETKSAQKKKANEPASSTSQSAPLPLEPKPAVVEDGVTDSLSVSSLTLAGPSSEKNPQKEKAKEETAPISSKSSSKSKEKGKQPTKASPEERVEEVRPKLQLAYTSWISDWFTDPTKALARPQYAHIQSHPSIQSKILAYHTLPAEIDQFIFTHGVESTWLDSKTGKDLKHYSIPCEIKFWDSGEVHRGSIGYCANQRGEYFHRCFSKKAPNEMVSEVLQKGFWNVDFPALSDSFEGSITSSAVTQLHHSRIRIRHTNSYTIEIDDPVNQVTIRIFNLKRFT